MSQLQGREERLQQTQNWLKAKAIDTFGNPLLPNGLTPEESAEYLARKVYDEVRAALMGVDHVQCYEPNFQIAQRVAELLGESRPRVTFTVFEYSAPQAFRQ